MSHTGSSVGPPRPGAPDVHCTSQLGYLHLESESLLMRAGAPSWASCVKPELHFGEPVTLPCRWPVPSVPRVCALECGLCQAGLL